MLIYVIGPVTGREKLNSKAFEDATALDHSRTAQAYYEFAGKENQDGRA